MQVRSYCYLCLVPLMDWQSYSKAWLLLSTFHVILTIIENKGN